MLPRITAARYVSGFVVWLRFVDGSEGTVDLSQELVGKIFEPLLDPKVFSQVTLHPELRTPVWPNGGGKSVHASHIWAAGFTTQGAYQSLT